MDPNETLRLIRQRIKDYAAEDNDMVLPAEEAMDAFLALDEWLTKGGFLPDAWRQRDGTLVALITDALLDGNLHPQTAEQRDRLQRAKALAQAGPPVQVIPIEPLGGEPTLSDNYGHRIVKLDEPEPLGGPVPRVGAGRSPRPQPDDAFHVPGYAAAKEEDR